MNRPPRLFGYSAATALALLAASAMLWPLVGVEVNGADTCRLFLPLREGEPLELSWRHSVDGILVRDVFTRRAQTLYLNASYNPYFAAGLGEVPGRGRVVGTENHGLAIIDINEPMQRLVLRVGGAEVAHTLRHRRNAHNLSARCPRQRVELSIARRPLFYRWWRG